MQSNFEFIFTENFTCEDEEVLFIFFPKLKLQSIGPIPARIATRLSVAGGFRASTAILSDSPTAKSKDSVAGHATEINVVADTLDRLNEFKTRY
mgnify:CR=1 FL=1